MAVSVHGTHGDVVPKQEKRLFNSGSRKEFSNESII